MKHTNPIKHETMPLKKLMRSPWGTVGQYTCDMKDTNRASSRITAYATHAGAKIQTERYSCINQRTGATMAIIQAKVTKRGRPLQKPGRKPLDANRSPV